MPSKPLTYLDHAATSPLRPEARAAMEPWLVGPTGSFGNASGSHAAARAARRAVDDARDTIAAAVGAQPGEIVFTSGGTESDNLAIAGVVRQTGGVAVCSAVEHHAVLHVVEAHGGRVVAVDRRGVVDVNALADALDDNVAVVSVMTANNECGVVQPLADIAETVREQAPRAVIHTDAVAAGAWIDLAEHAAMADLVSLSGHKFGGPQGVGVLVVRDGVRLAPMLLGGGQERERRSGTHNVAGIVGLAAALQATVDGRKPTNDAIGQLRDRLADGLVAATPDTFETAMRGSDGSVLATDRSHKVPGSCHVCFADVESEALLFLLDQAGICASAASSCASGALDPSHVLAAMGIPRELAGGSLRLSLGWSTTAADVDRALAVVPAAIAQLRAEAGSRVR